MTLAGWFVGNVFGPVEKLADGLVKFQGYRHYGYQRYLNICSAGPSGDFPNLRVEFAVSPLARIGRVIGRVLRREFNRGMRCDRYHEMELYRAKLRAFAKKLRAFAKKLRAFAKKLRAFAKKRQQDL